MSMSPDRRGKKSPPPRNPETEPDTKVRLLHWADANSQAVLEAAPDAMLMVARWRAILSRDRAPAMEFQPAETERETEDYAVELSDVTALELKIVPDKSGGEARASLEC